MLEFVGVLYFEGLKAYAQGRRGGSYRAPVRMQESTGRIPKDSQTGRLEKSLDEQLRLSGGYVGTCIEGYTSDVPAGMWETLDETLAYRISCIRKDNRDRCRSIFSRLGGRRSSCDDYIDLETDQFCSRILEPLNISNSKPAFNEDVLSLNPAEIPQLLKEGVISGYGRSKSEITYLSRLQRLLRARRERPRGRRAAKQRNEFAPLHSITSSASCWMCNGTSRPSAFAVVRFTTRSNLVGCWTGMSPGFAPRRILST